MFSRIDPKDMPIVNPKNFPEYYVAGEFEVGEILYKSGNTYLDIVVDEGVPYASVICLKGSANLFGIKDVLDEILSEYGSVGFYWVKGIRNEIYIKRLIRNYKIVEAVYNSEENTIKVICKPKEVIK